MNDLYTSYKTVKDTNKETIKKVIKNPDDTHIYVSWPKQLNSWANSSSYPPPPSSPPPPLPKQLPLINRNNKKS